MTFENILLNNLQSAILPYIDVLVDGRFEQDLHDESLLFKGSTNQRLIDVQRSMNENKLVLWEYNPFVFERDLPYRKEIFQY